MLLVVESTLVVIKDYDNHHQNAMTEKALNRDVATVLMVYEMLLLQ